jgi:ribonuclease D
MSRPARPAFPATTVITGSAALAALCDRLAGEEFVTVDTEFMREKTYWPELCVVQLAGTNDVAVVDALAPGLDLAPLGRLLATPNITKVFHAARQDVEIFLQLFGAVATRSGMTAWSPRSLADRSTRHIAFPTGRRGPSARRRSTMPPPM